MTSSTQAENRFASDRADDPLLTLDEGAERFFGRRIPRSTWLRWSRKGVRGLRLRLELCGGRRMIRESAWREWHAALNGENISQEKESAAGDK